MSCPGSTYREYAYRRSRPGPQLERMSWVLRASRSEPSGMIAGMAIRAAYLLERKRNGDEHSDEERVALIGGKSSGR